MQKLLILILIGAGFYSTKDHNIENKEPEVPKRLWPDPDDAHLRQLYLPDLLYQCHDRIQ